MDNLGDNLKNTYANSPLLRFMSPSGHFDTQWVASLPGNLGGQFGGGDLLEDNLKNDYTNSPLHSFMAQS